MEQQAASYDAVNEGDAAPEMSRELSRTDLVMYAGASGDFNRIHWDEEFARSLASTTGNFDRISAGLAKGEGTAGKLLKDEALYKRLDAVTGRLDTLLTRLNDGQGTAGQLLQDKKLYENMNGAVGDLRSLLTEIKKDPKKYLNVRVSIF